MAHLDSLTGYVSPFELAAALPGEEPCMFNETAAELGGEKCPADLIGQPANTTYSYNDDVDDSNSSNSSNSSDVTT